MGGAFGALGADFSNLSSNPAGIGLFRKSEFTITPSIFNASTESDYLGNSFTDNHNNFALGNVGVVYAWKPRFAEDSLPGFRNFQFGFGINRMKDFNNRYIIQGYNTSSSLMTDYVNTANEDKRRPENLHPFDTRLAYDTYLIDPIAPDSTSYTSTLMNGNMLQHKTGTYSGSANEFVISGGTNLSDKFYFGGTIGIPYFYYKERSDYTETDSKELNNFINNYTITDRQTDNGVGINYKIGMIFRASDILRLGAAYHSPSFYAISRTFTREIQSNLDNGDSFDYQSPKADFTYNLQTPVHLLGSAAIIFGKSGAIDIDYEYVNYSTMKLRNGSDGDDFFNQNEAISKIYRDQHNLRIGGELKLPAVTLRAGFNYSTSPYIDTNYDERKSVSLGLGFRDKNYFYDIGYVYTFYNQEYYLYNPELVKPSVNTFANNTFSVTIGYKF